MASDQKLYDTLASWWPLLSAPEEYAEEADFYRRFLDEACAPRRVLELGSGGGNNASHLKQYYELTLVDRSPAMLEVSRTLNPECTHHEGDMRTVRLGAVFDAVFVHDAVMYMATTDDLRAALVTAFVHCRPGGAALIVPDDFRETFEPDTDHGGHDGPDGRALRYLEWSHPANPDATSVVVDYVVVTCDGDEVSVSHDRHVEGLFPRDTWLDLCRDVGFEPRIRTVMHTDLAPKQSEVIVCRRPRET